MDKKSKIPKGLILEPKTFTKEESQKLIKSWEEANRGSYNPEGALIEPYNSTIKPIFTIGLPGALNLTREEFEDLQKRNAESLSDYHVLLYIDHFSNTPIFQAFYEKDFKEDEFNKLKQQILNSLK